MKRILLKSLFGLVAIVCILGIYLFIEDKSYGEYVVHLDNMNESRKGLIIAFETNDNESFWNHYDKTVQPLLEEKHMSNDVIMVMPFQHKALSHPDSDVLWTNSTVILFSENVDVENLGYQLLDNINSSVLKDQLRSVDILRLQKGLDMLYPIKGGVERESNMDHMVEYVFSDPLKRQQYYEEQYIWSGPAMADLHSRDKVGRFIGFELEERLYGSESMPEWDLIHVIGFTKWQMVKMMPFYNSTWNKHAKRAFESDVTYSEKLSEWDELRLNIRDFSKLNMSLTLKKLNE